MEKFKRNPFILNSELDDNQIMMHLEQGKYFGLNPVGKRIWDLIEQPKDKEELLTSLLAEYDVSREQCTSEIETFLAKAIKYDIVIRDEMGS